MKFTNTLFFIMLCFAVHAQSKSKLLAEDILSISYSKELQTPSHIVFNEKSKVKKAEIRALIATIFEIDKHELILKKTTSLAQEVVVERYTRHIDGIRVPHCGYTAIKKNGELQSIHAEHYKVIASNKNAILSEVEALSSVLPKLGSELFAWESTAQLMSAYNKDSDTYKKLAKALKKDYPTGEIVYLSDYYSDHKELEKAYLFTIESVSPEFRDRVYVSAADGRILLRDPQLKHGSGDTRYSENKSFPTTEISGPPGAIYELKGIESSSGIYCETRSLEGLGGTPVSTPAIAALSDSIADGDEMDPCLLDNDMETIAEFGDDEWDANEHRKVAFTGGAQSCCLTYVPLQCDELRNDDIALDAHWGASIVVKYFKEIHNRFGYDDEGADIYSYVHHGLSHENASWNGLIMKYGDGAYQDGTNPGGMFGPLVSLDVCAHEIGHAICTSTSDLVYSGESGAMNEGLSDIWAACIEGFVLNTIDSNLDYVLWGIGEQIDQRDAGLYNEPGARAIRWMDHPPAENNPDTYGAGTWWQDPDCPSPNVANDFCGIHFNSGVLNKWFYLLTEGSGKAFSPGLNKPAFDDEINDKGNSYSVEGIGLSKSEKIVYGANLLLLPNSKFADMRAASIDIARSIYGPCSNEVEQTIRAWYAVGVGSDFGSCLPTISYNEFNPREIFETSLESGCQASSEINLSIFSYMANEIITFTTSGNAVENEDYELCFSSLDFSGDEEKQLKVTIFDDKIEEGTDTIIIHFQGGPYTDSDTIIILDDDAIPAIGSSEILFSDNFDSDTGLWQQELVNPTSMINEWYIDALDNNQAHISFPPTTNVTTYTQAVESHIRLRSPLINALGRKNVSVSFTYEVGGERDLVDPSAIFDYGTFEISYDGFDWEEIQLFVGDAMTGGTITEAGAYNSFLPQLDNATFYLGFTWFNDALNGTDFSFMIDDIMVEGEGLEIASSIGSEMETNIPALSRIGYISTNNNEVIAIVEEAKSDLGCTSISIIDNDLATDITPAICHERGTKVYKLDTELPADSISLTLFFNESEVDEWVNPSGLNILAVEDNDINNIESTYTIIDNEDMIVGDFSDNGMGYYTYTFWTASSTQTISLTDIPSSPLSRIVTNSTDNNLGSLRDIIFKACPEDTIRFDPSTDNSIIELVSGSLVIDKDLYILGNGADKTFINGNSITPITLISGATIILDNINIQSDNPHSTISNNGEIIIRNDVIIRQ